MMIYDINTVKNKENQETTIVYKLALNRHDDYQISFIDNQKMKTKSLEVNEIQLISSNEPSLDYQFQIQNHKLKYTSNNKEHILTIDGKRADQMFQKIQQNVHGSNNQKVTKEQIIKKSREVLATFNEVLSTCTKRKDVENNEVLLELNNRLDLLSNQIKQLLQVEDNIEELMVQYDLIEKAFDKYNEILCSGDDEAQQLQIEEIKPNYPINKGDQQQPENLIVLCDDEEVEEEKKPQAPNEPLQKPEDEDLTCIICMQKLKTHACLPCGHLKYCSNCILIIVKNKQCAFCRTPITGSLQIYT